MSDPAAGQRVVAVLDSARADAAARGSDAIAAEHLMLAAMASPVALEAFRTASVSPEELRQRVEAGIRAGKGEKSPEELALSSQGRRLASAAEREAAGRGAEVAAEHFLIAAFTEPRGSLARALSELQVSPRTLRDAIYAAAGLSPLPKAPRQQDQEAAAPEVQSSKPTSAPPPAEPQTPAPARAPTARRAKGERRREPAPPARQTDRPPGGRLAPPVPERAEATTPEREVKPRRPLKHLRKDPDAWGPLWRRLLLLALPAAAWASGTHQAPLLVFLLACCAVVPLAGFMGDATEHLAARTGPTVGGLLNATFGNAAELIIGLVALNAGLIPLVKFSIIGSILGNLLLIMGLSLVAGGLRATELRFSRTAAGMSAGMLAAAVVGLVFPALMHATHPAGPALDELHMSEGVAAVLLATYGFSLLFTLKTHKWLMGGDPHEVPRRAWGAGKALLVLAIATAAIAYLSEMLVHSVQEAGDAVGLTPMFVGLIIIPIIGNAAEHASAIMMARRGKMDLSLQIAYGSSTQIALLVAPVLVFAGIFMGQDMNLVFTPFEVMAVGLAVVITAIGTTDGESHWFEGVMLLAVYALIGIAAFFV